MNTRVMQQKTAKFLDTNLILAIALALICTTTIAMAQTSPTISWRNYGQFPKLPPLRSDFDLTLFNHFQPNMLQMPIENNKDTIATQSIMLRHADIHTTPNLTFKFKPGTFHMKTGDALKGIREHIVRERRKEGCILPPPPKR